jgi:hypothetical protein
MNYAVLLSAIALSSALLVLNARAAQASAAQAPALQEAGQADPAAALPPDTIQIYRAFISSYTNGSPAPLHLANLTAPFDTTQDDLAGCLKDFPEHPEATGTHSLSALNADSNVQLVDAEEYQLPAPSPHDDRSAAANKAISTLSEIVFTADHQFAALNYNLACGGLCIRGGTAVFERSANGWVRINRFCPPWHN